MKEMHAVIHGKVQGVWFRAWTQDMARELGVTGWVRNTESGDVEAVCQGTEAEIGQFLKRLHDGPPLARVTKIDSSMRLAKETLTSFTVRS